MANRDIKDLHPDLQPLARAFLDQCADNGIHAILIQTYRSKEEQDADYRIGRTEPGHKITNAQGGQSPHNSRLPDGTPAACAFDFAIFGEDGKHLDWDAADDRWEKAFEIVKGLGLVSGSIFHGIKDSDHVELPNWKQLSINQNIN